MTLIALAAALAGGVAALPAAGEADRAEDRTTLERTTLDTDRDNRLDLAPGEHDTAATRPLGRSAPR